MNLVLRTGILAGQAPSNIVSSWQRSALGLTLAAGFAWLYPPYIWVPLVKILYLDRAMADLSLTGEEF